MAYAIIVIETLTFHVTFLSEGEGTELIALSIWGFNSPTPIRFFSGRGVAALLFHLKTSGSLRRKAVIKGASMAPGDFDTSFVAMDVSVACTAGDRIVAQMARAWLITSYCRRFESC